MGRAFQFVELFRHMTMLDSLMLGRHLHMRAGLGAGAAFFGRPRREQARHRARVEEIVAEEPPGKALRAPHVIEAYLGRPLEPPKGGGS